MLNISKSMQPVVDQWKSNNYSLGEGRHLRATARPEDYTVMMDTVVRADNKGLDQDPRPGLVLVKSDNPAPALTLDPVLCTQNGETHRYSGNSMEGHLESVMPNGDVYFIAFSPKHIDFLQVSEDHGGVHSMHQHLDRETGRGWLQLGGAGAL